MLNKTRQLYRQIIKKRQPSNTDVDKAIEDGLAVSNFRKTRAGHLLKQWIDEQKQGQLEYLEVEIGSLTGLNILKFLNAFLKYVYMLQENRGYKKLEAYLDSVERTGKDYEERRRRESQKNTDKQD